MAPPSYLLILFLQFLPSVFGQADEFVSIDCGGISNYTDASTGLTWISDIGYIKQGKVVEIEIPNGDRLQYQRRRDFPADGKYCYSLRTTERWRYLVRATFQYGNSNSEEPFPKFQLYLDATRWSTVTVQDALRVYVEEMIIRAPSNSIDVCLCCASTGTPFISTLELRPLNLSMYATDYEDDFFLKVAARVNFGAPTKDAIRYPDDPYDRIWSSDQEKKQNYLVGVAPGTERVSTSKSIDTRTREYPPVKVMQTAVVGTEGSLSYRLDLEGFPGNARAYAFLAEIEDLGRNETRKFTMQQPRKPGYNNIVVNIAENANGSYTLYEPSYMNISLDFVFSFSFVKTRDSTHGPLLNAIEIDKYVLINPKTTSKDKTVLNRLEAMYQGSHTHDGDPCNPISWEWVTCSTNTPPRITKIVLSGRNLKGNIPFELKYMDELTELWLDGNSLSGQIPDLSKLINLTTLHLENNRLTGPLPSYLGDLPNLQELYVQNNSLHGEIAPKLLTQIGKFNYSGNPDLYLKTRHKNLKLILGTTVGAFALFLAMLLGSFLLLYNLRKRTSKSNSLKNMPKPSASYAWGRSEFITEDNLDVSYHIALSDLEEATQNFSKNIGKGSFGPVYYGRMKDGREVAVKIMAEASSHGEHQFLNEVALLSRIHHKHLVPLIGYCKESDQRILVYEYMHNGTLQDHIHGSDSLKYLDWLSRLSTAEDAAKGLEYLHSGCNPSIIHRDVKTSNILLDLNMRAKVSDFGLSRQTDENYTHVSSVACGTVGYLDPEYYGNQQLTEKSDIYSFGVVLLELISGRKPFSVEAYGPEWNIIHWARSLIRKGDVTSIVDPSLAGNFKMESFWRIAEVALLSVEPHGASRPKMQEIVLAIQDAIKIEKGSKKCNYQISSISSTMHLSEMRLPSNDTDIESLESANGCIAPSAR
ncbi:hypothetical protein AQUCO_01100348v1 [Aquilegia coerulea]|uniref:non-specific serine/threonine protein kinase n=1 Tax=Aquilegia coerulea TaxID=218851 RepID=A0A2G5E6Q5_AQUCA|nr:hypothetical protein AQUCO_01100348v1 [Aquilegia coerulea]